MPHEIKKNPPVRNRKYLFILRIPPPFGGGEIVHQSLYQHYSTRENHRLLVISSPKRTKGNQSAFAIWKFVELFWSLIKFVKILYSQKPCLMFLSIGKGFPHFVRDSIFVYLAKIMSVPVAAEIHGSGLYFSRRSLLGRHYAKFVCKQIVSVRVLGNSIKAELNSYGISNTIVIDNGVSVPKARTHILQKNFSGIHLLYAGTLGKQKGFDLVLDACKRLSDESKSFTVHCLGPWISDQYMMDSITFIQKNNLQKNFIFYGLCHGETKWEVFRTSDILILPSYNEGQPLVILEAFAFGLAVIASSVGAIPDTVSQSVNGLLIQPGCPEELHDSINTLICNKSMLLQIQSTNRKVFEERYSLPNFLTRYEQWIQECATK